jgi:hypothetical protein
MDHILTHHVTLLWCLACGRLRSCPAIEVDRVPNMRRRARCTKCGGRDIALRVVHVPAVGGIGYHGWELRRIADAVRDAAQREQGAALAAHASGHTELWNRHDMEAAVLRRLHQGLVSEADSRDEQLARAMTTPR